MDSTKSGSVQSLYFTYYLVCTWTVENQGKSIFLLITYI